MYINTGNETNTNQGDKAMNAKLEIKRADGTIEWIESNYHHIYYPQVPRIERECIESGLGQMLSYKNPETETTSRPTAKPMTSRQFYAKIHAEEHRENGRCPRCGTWCYGDCTATH